METQTQRVYHISNKTLIYISPYARILRINEKQIRIFREEIGTGIILTATDLNTVEYLLKLLNRGIEKSQLAELLKRLGVDDSNSWIDLCKRKGVIE